MLRKSVLILLFAVMNIWLAGATVSTDVRQENERATSLIEHGRFSEARKLLTELRTRIPIDDEVLARHIDFSLVRCAAELRDNGAENLMNAFLRRYPESVHTNDVRFLLGLYYCEHEEFAKARKCFDRVSYKALTSENREKFNMRMGYIEFVSGNYDKAYELFSMLSPTGRYAEHATYYKAYIRYAQGDYKQAYTGFSSLIKSDSYSKIIPYYLFQIEFASGNHRYVTKHGDELLKNAVASERTELMRIIAESWYHLQGYSKARHYMLGYRATGGKMGREENYLLGYSSYRSTDYTTAIETLRKVAEGNDELAQNASYHLADCYINRGEKRKAIDAFAIAADAKFDKEIAKDALFNYGKLLFETGGGTFNESINVLTRCVKEYPDSERANEARELLIAAYYNSHDYDMAYKAIKAFPNPDGSQRAALQKIAYFNGLRAFTYADYEKATAALSEAQKVGVSPKYNALCLFWLGEIAYQQGDYSKAIGYYNNYIRRAPKSEREYKMALYNLGYSHFSQDNMAKSQKAFEGFVWLYKAADRYRADAFNRLGDAQYSQRKYSEAVKSYEGAIALGTSDQDYAKFQRAISLGLAGRTNAKIGALVQMQGENCGDYNDDAAYELGRTYVRHGRYADGAAVLEKFVEKYPQSPYHTPALLDLGLVHFNLGDNDKSLHYYDKVISAAPQSSAAKSAMQSVREIYVAKGNIDEYFAYAERTGVVCDLGAMTRDSLSFRAAQNIYLAGRTEEAVSHFNNYIKNYPKGYYINDALFCLSDCYLKCDSLDRAVENLKLLAEQPKNQYTVPVVEKLAKVTFDNKMYGESAPAYRRMYDVVDTSVARTAAANGYAESVLLRNDDDTVMAMASDLDTLADVDAAMLRRVRFAKANVLSRRGDSESARKIYEMLASDMLTAEGAESAYRVIEALFKEGSYDESEKRIYALADSKTSHSYWLGKAFILLGDIYVARNDIFQAKATYRSVVDGYTPTDDGIVAEAQAKLNKLN